MKFILKYLKNVKLYYFGSMIALVISAIFEMVSPFIIKITIDSIIGNKAISGNKIIINIFNSLGGRENLLGKLWVCGLLIMGVALIQNLFLYFKGIWATKASESFAKELKDGIYKHIGLLPYEYHQKIETGDLIQRATSDVETIRTFIAKQLISLVKIIATIILVLMIIFKLNVELALYSLVLIPVIFGFSVYFFKKIEEIFTESDEAEGRLTSMLQENLTGIRVVRAFAKQAFEMKKFRVKNAEFNTTRKKLIRYFAMFWSISYTICMFQIAIVLIKGSSMTILGTISLGTFIAFMFYIEKFIWPIRELARVLADMGQVKVSIKRVKEILAEKTEDLESGIDSGEIKGDLIFENVGFAYEEGKDIIKGFDLKVNRGETIAILGPTGSGKSTLMHLLVRLYDLNKGKILLDGKDINEYSKSFLRKNVGLILQEPFLFSKSLKGNIKAARMHAREDEIIEAATVSSIHNVILGFEKAYETMVGEQGVTLSGGQKQRIAIARTIINSCPVVVFDDSLSAVDSETDKEIRDALNNRQKKATTFIISHRISTLSEADRIVILNKGKVEDIGTHYELINRAGLYKTIYDIEKSNEID